MMHVFNSWLVWLGLGGGTIGIIVLAFVAPSVLDIASKVLSGLISLAGPPLQRAAATVATGTGPLRSGNGSGRTREKSMARYEAKRSERRLFESCLRAKGYRKNGAPPAGPAGPARKD